MKVLKKLHVGTPSVKLVDGYLVEIARGYNIDWEPPSLPEAEENLPSFVGGSGEVVKEVCVYFSRPTIQY